MNLRKEICDILIEIPFTDKYSVGEFETTVNRIQLLFNKYYISKEEIQKILDSVLKEEPYNTIDYAEGFARAMMKVKDMLK